MKILYRVLTTIIYPLLIIFIFFRQFIKKEDKKRYKEKIFSPNFNVKRDNNFKLIWFHAASIGELKSILPIIKELDKKNNNLEFLVTTVTLSSANLAKTELKEFKRVYHRFFPVDVFFLVNKFLNLWKPNAIFLVDSEIWPNLIFIASEKKIPLAIINARITGKTYRKWMILPNFAKSIFKLFDLCLTSNNETKKYLENLNAKNIFFFGNLKFCEQIQYKKDDPNKDFLLSNKFWLAASTHEGEDEFCFNAHINLKKHIKNIITIVVPRHINRVNKIKKIADNHGLNCQILNKEDKILIDKEIIIINSFGTLTNFFRYAKSVFIGKSMLKHLKRVGGQNPIEAAKLGCKIYYGPYVYNFQEIYELLAKNKVAVQINNSDELVNGLLKDLSNDKNELMNFIPTINILAQEILDRSIQKINKEILNENS